MHNSEISAKDGLSTTTKPTVEEKKEKKPVHFYLKRSIVVAVTISMFENCIHCVFNVYVEPEPF